MSFTPGRFLPGVHLPLLLIVCGTSACREAAAPPPPAPRAIRWVRVGEGLASQQRTLAGAIAAIDQTKLGFQVSGTVTEVAVKPGESVRAGQTLARLDSEPFDIAVRDAEAVLAKDRALYEEANSSYDRSRKLYEAGVSSEAEFTRDRARRDAKSSQVRASEARLEQARRDRRNTLLIAPFDGTISARNIEPAQEFQIGQTALEMDSETGGLGANVMVPETLIQYVQVGQPVEVLLVTQARRAVAARVTEVSSRAGPGNAFPVEVAFEEPVAGLSVGMTAEVRFRYSDWRGLDREERGFMVPVESVIFGPDNAASVFVFDPDSSTVRHTPVRLAAGEAKQVAVVGGLEEGDIVATAGASFLHDGQSVTLMATDEVADSRS